MNTSEAFSGSALREALGHFGTGVTIVSTLAPGGRLVGVTANSFNSVSLEPPIVLWSLRASSPNLDAFDSCGRFVVHVLTTAQVALSRRFASPVPDKFAGVAHARGLGGLPVIDDCAAVFECRTLQRHAVGDHVLYLGAVEALGHRPRPQVEQALAEKALTGQAPVEPGQMPLLYCHGRYARPALCGAPA